MQARKTLLLCIHWSAVAAVRLWYVAAHLGDNERTPCLTYRWMLIVLNAFWRENSGVQCWIHGIYLTQKTTRAPVDPFFVVLLLCCCCPCCCRPVSDLQPPRSHRLCARDHVVVVVDDYDCWKYKVFFCISWWGKVCIICLLDSFVWEVTEHHRPSVLLWECCSQ